MEFKKLRILCSAMDSQGHVNAILGFAKILEQRGHQVIMALTPGWESLIKKHNFEFVPLQTESGSSNEEANGKKEEDVNNNVEGKQKDAPNQQIIKVVESQLKRFRLSPMDALRYGEDETETWTGWFDKLFVFNDALKLVLEQIKPDMVVVDFLMRLPCLEVSKIPWAQLWSANPIMLYRDHCPPATTGFSTDSPKELWKEYQTLRDIKEKKITDHVNKRMVSQGVRPYGKDEPIQLGESPFINFYTYPEFLDYHDIAPRPVKWVRMDTSVREPDDASPFEIPEKLAGGSGKLIYFSLGSMGSIDLELMKRVISVCAKSPHRFIVSKGPLHEQIDLPDNMWGDRYLNQIAILPYVDLVITHGGNNTLTESLYFGKPIIVMPLFFDQLDNAQRIKEKNFGIRIDTYHFKDSDLLDAIENLLNDEPLKVKLATISKQLRASDTKETVCQLIEKTVALRRSPFDSE